MRRLIQGVLGVALAVLGAAHGHVLPLAQGAGAPAYAFRTLARGARPTAELRPASEKARKAPSESAARTRRPSTSTGSGALPGVTPVSAISAPVIPYIRGVMAAGSLTSECGHCTRAPRPPPIS